MGSWFINHRQEYIRAHLATFGQIRRADICNRFEITTQVASADIAKFLADNPDAMIFDGRAKCYVLNEDVTHAD